MNVEPALSTTLYFSYSQFLVYDENVYTPGCVWTEQHSAQGFARRESTVNFNTLLECGYAKITARCCAYQVKSEYDRVIAVPFLVLSGKVAVEGPDEPHAERKFNMVPGNYRLVAAQRIIDDEQEAIDLFFQPLPKPLEQSCVIVADSALNPHSPLIEEAAIAAEQS